MCFVPCSSPLSIIGRYFSFTVFLLLPLTFAFEESFLLLILFRCAIITTILSSFSSLLPVCGVCSYGKARTKGKKKGQREIKRQKSFQ